MGRWPEASDVHGSEETRLKWAEQSAGLLSMEWNDDVAPVFSWTFR